jgi:RHS repeat-associated protein
MERQTAFAYNRLSQLITQTAQNKSSTGTPLANQLTTYRYDSLGRQTRIVYPDSTQHADPLNCTDCVRQMFDVAGRMTQRTDQRGLTTTFAYDDRGLLLTRTTGTDRDTFAYDAVGRITLADRGTTVDPDAISHSVMAYTDLGDLDFETQVIAWGAARTVDYTYDQAGNRKQLTYPGGEVLAYTPTALDQVDSVTLDANPLVDYSYQGRLLDKRRTTTTAPGGTTVYEYDVGYDSHRRVSTLVNRFQPNGGNPQTLAAYGFSHDGNGNPLTQTVSEGLPTFVADDRAFTVDRLNRLTGTEYFENGQVESTTFDLVGNRESHTDRAGTVTAFGTVNAANEYPTIGGIAVTYDAAGNLSVDQNGRQYSYEEHNRLTQIKAADETVLANYTYDALGRRITFNDPVAAVTTRYYYDGQSVIEERNGADARVRFHVNGAQYIDERVATFADASSEFTYYLGSNNFSITGTGNADGSVIERLDYSSTGDFAGGGPGAGAFYHDADADLDIDLRDFANFQVCFDPSGTQTTQACLDVHDFDTSDASDGDIDLDDFARFVACSRGPFVTPDQSCGIPMRAGAPPPSGTFGMHGRAFDVLSDGFVLQDFRARTYFPEQGRWLQRDALDYVDTRNLYEAFATNPLSRLDPHGLDSVRRTNGFLEYATDGFAWDFAKVLGNGLVLIDHPQWPFAFVMKEQDALREFRTGRSRDDFYNVFSIMSHATSLATQSGSKNQIVALFDKRSTSLGWVELGEINIDTLISLRELGTSGLQAQLAGVGNLTATAFTVTTGALAAPAGAGAAIVDVGAAAVDVASGDVSLRRGAFVITAVAAGAALHLRFADDAVLGAGGAARRAVVTGGAAPVRKGFAAEARVAEAIGVPRNVGAGRITIESLTGSAKFRVPDFGPEATIALRGSIVEVKNVTRLQITPQLRDLVAQARKRGVVLEIFTNGTLPHSGELADLLKANPQVIRITPLP